MPMNVALWLLPAGLFPQTILATCYFCVSVYFRDKIIAKNNLSGERQILAPGLRCFSPWTPGSMFQALNRGTSRQRAWQSSATYLMVARQQQNQSEGSRDNLHHLKRGTQCSTLSSQAVPPRSCTMNSSMNLPTGKIGALMTRVPLNSSARVVLGGSRLQHMNLRLEVYIPAITFHFWPPEDSCPT